MKRLIKLCVGMCVALLMLTLITPDEVSAASPKLSKTSVSLEVGKSKTIKLNNATGKITWKSSDKKIATVKASGENGGKITAVKKGTCTITATCGKKSYTCKVTVTKAAKATPTPKPSPTPIPVLTKVGDVTVLDNVEMGEELSADCYDVFTICNGKYTVVRQETGNSSMMYGGSSSWLFDREGNLLLSGAKYAMYMPLTDTRVIAWGVDKRHYQTQSGVMGDTCNGTPYLVNFESKEISLVRGLQGQPLITECAGNGLALCRICRDSLSQSKDEYYFIDQDCNIVIKPQLYQMCTRFICVDGEYYYYTRANGETFVAQRNSKGEIVKKYEMLETEHDWAFMFEYEGEYYLYRLSMNNNPKVYDLQFNDVTDSVYGVQTFGRNLNETRLVIGEAKQFPDTSGLAVGYKKLLCVNKPDMAVAIKDQGYKAGDKLVVSELYNEDSIFAYNFLAEMGTFCQNIGFEPLGGGKYRLWSLRTDAQLRSDEDGNFILGTYTDEEDQVFTLTENADGSCSLIDYKGRYLTYAGTKEGSALKFKKPSNGSDQKFYLSNNELSSLNGRGKYQDDYNKTHVKGLTAQYIYAVGAKGAVVDVYDQATAAYSYIGLYDKGTSKNQKFAIEELKDGRCHIWAVQADRMLMSHNGRLEVGSGAEIPGEIFTIRQNSDGSCSIIDEYGKLLTVGTGRTIVFKEEDGTDAQRFTFNKK